MTPEARVSAAIEILDTILTGTPSQKALTQWSRNNRYAGSKDRRAIQDDIYDVQRRRSSLSHLNLPRSGRALMIALLLARKEDLERIFCTARFAPNPLSEEEQNAVQQCQQSNNKVIQSSKPWLALDIPEWLWPQWKSDLGENAEKAAKVLQSRAQTYLRVNPLKAKNIHSVQEALRAEGLDTQPHATLPECLELISPSGRLAHSAAYMNGEIEIQDAASQWAMYQTSQCLTSPPQTIFDYCAGGGGKSLAIGALYPKAQLTAFDVEQRRMKDLPSRASRAGLKISTLKTPQDLPYNSQDLVLCDAPCSGSGTWRRTPDAKWDLTPETLTKYQSLQKETLHLSSQFVAQSGTLIYMTCSVLSCENKQIISCFLAKNPHWTLKSDITLMPTKEHDGFYLAQLKRVC